MRTYLVPHEPAALHLGVAHHRTAPARHLSWIGGQVHVLRSIPVDVIDTKHALASWKVARRIGIGPAIAPFTATASRVLAAARRADA